MTTTAHSVQSQAWRAATQRTLNVVSTQQWTFFLMWTTVVDTPQFPCELSASILRRYMQLGARARLLRNALASDSIV